MISTEFSLFGARKARAEGKSQAWLETYLEINNVGLKQGLQRRPRYWTGPELLPLDSLLRCCGPEAEMEYRMPRVEWERRLKKMQLNFVQLENFPPLITQYRSGIFSVRDGNTRHEVFSRQGITHCWTWIWYDTAEDLIRAGRNPAQAIFIDAIESSA